MNRTEPNIEMSTKWKTAKWHKTTLPAWCWGRYGNAVCWASITISGCGIPAGHSTCYDSCWSVTCEKDIRTSSKWQDKAVSSLYCQKDRKCRVTVDCDICHLPVCGDHSQTMLKCHMCSGQIEEPDDDNWTTSSLMLIVRDLIGKILRTNVDFARWTCQACRKRWRNSRRNYVGP